MVDILDENKTGNRLKRIVRKVVGESQLYSNIASLEVVDQEKITQAISDITRILSEMRPDFDDNELATATADTLFSVLCLKKSDRNEAVSSNLNSN
ncbi:MAG TPA: hypothetical protein VNX68_10970 [Nitrosopumilaceae archaeon]|nr:hypothetical protein [Nitrosopumilaceae archaeon]